MKEYKITYKNGNELKIKAYNIEKHNNTYYMVNKAYTGDGPEWTIIEGDKIEKIEGVTK